MYAKPMGLKQDRHSCQALETFLINYNKVNNNE